MENNLPGPISSPFKVLLDDLVSSMCGMKLKQIQQGQLTVMRADIAVSVFVILINCLL